MHHAEEHPILAQLGAAALEPHHAGARTSRARIVGAAARRHEGQALRPVQRSPDLARAEDTPLSERQADVEKPKHLARKIQRRKETDR